MESPTCGKTALIHADEGNQNQPSEGVSEKLLESGEHKSPPEHTFIWRLGARSAFGFGVASGVPWGWRDSYGKTGNFGRVGDKSMFKMYQKAGVGREGDI